MPPTMIDTVGAPDAASDEPLAPPLLEHAVVPRARARTAAPQTTLLRMGHFLSWSESLDGVSGQMTWVSDRRGGRQPSTRFSSNVIRNSAMSLKTAMIVMQAKTVFGSKFPWASL